MTLSKRRTKQRSTAQIKKVMAVPGTNSGTPEMIRQSYIVFGFYNGRDVTEQVRDANLPILRNTIDTYGQWMKEGKLEIRFSGVQQLIWHGEEAKAVIRRWEKGPMTPGVEGPRADTVEVVQRAIVLR